MTRFQTRERMSGALNAQPLWGDALSHVKKGWGPDPLPVDPVGEVAT